MKSVTTALLWVALVLIAYYAIDAITTRDPNRRRTDLRDLRIIGAGVNAIKAI